MPRHSLLTQRLHGGGANLAAGRSQTRDNDTPHTHTHTTSIIWKLPTNFAQMRPIKKNVRVQRGNRVRDASLHRIRICMDVYIYMRVALCCARRAHNYDTRNISRRSPSTRISAQFLLSHFFSEDGVRTPTTTRCAQRRAAAEGNVTARKLLWRARLRTFVCLGICMHIKKEQASEPTDAGAERTKCNGL